MLDEVRACMTHTLLEYLPKFTQDEIILKAHTELPDDVFWHSDKILTKNCDTLRVHTKF